MPQWNKIKAEYLQGVAPKDLAKKYKVAAKTIHEKASKENWVDEKASICKNLQEKLKGRIEGLTNLALEALEAVITNPEAENKDKVAASKAILDISGLKASKKEITGKDGEPLQVKKVFITAEEQKEVKEHIEEVINARINK